MRVLRDFGTLFHQRVGEVPTILSIVIRCAATLVSIGLASVSDHQKSAHAVHNASSHANATIYLSVAIGAMKLAFAPRTGGLEQTFTRDSPIEEANLYDFLSILRKQDTL
jgi:hypothetical protein